MLRRARGGGGGLGVRGQNSDGLPATDLRLLVEQVHGGVWFGPIPSIPASDTTTHGCCYCFTSSAPPRCALLGCAVAHLVGGVVTIVMYANAWTTELQSSLQAAHVLLHKRDTRGISRKILRQFVGDCLTDCDRDHLL